MKNIHLLPTDKPSRLWIWMDELRLGNLTSPSKLLTISNQNLYITSDEEIMEGDYWYDYLLETVNKGNLVGIQRSKKIILTTDQDLIKDGVQAIDDTFLQWFVKNPSCEEVKVDSKLIVRQVKPLLQHQGTKPIVVPHKIEYKLIIPKEEQKQHLIDMMKSDEELGLYDEKIEDIELEEVRGSSHCQFSVVENKLAIIYRNQLKILQAIKMLSNGTK